MAAPHLHCKPPDSVLQGALPFSQVTLQGGPLKVAGVTFLLRHWLGSLRLPTQSWLWPRTLVWEVMLVVWGWGGSFHMSQDFSGFCLSLWPSGEMLSCSPC